MQAALFQRSFSLGEHTGTGIHAGLKLQASRPWRALVIVGHTFTSVHSFSVHIGVPIRDVLYVHCFYATKNRQATKPLHHLGVT